MYIFDEVMGTLIERSEKLCLRKEGGLRSYLAEGLLHVQQIDPAEMTPGAFAGGPPFGRRGRHHRRDRQLELFAYLNQKGVTTIMVVAQHGLVVGTGASGEIDVSYLADTVLLFRYFETRAEIHQRSASSNIGRGRTREAFDSSRSIAAGCRSARS